jgi:hypothetical protein
MELPLMPRAPRLMVSQKVNTAAMIEANQFVTSFNLGRAPNLQPLQPLGHHRRSKQIRGLLPVLKLNRQEGLREEGARSKRRIKHVQEFYQTSPLLSRIKPHSVLCPLLVPPLELA